MRLSPTFFGFPLSLVVAGMWLLSCQSSTTMAQQSLIESSGQASDTNQAAKTQFVTVTIDYGDGFQKRFVKIAWHAGMNVLDAMQMAKKHKRAGFDFKFQGRGETALLYKIDDLRSEGGGQRNWIFYVNQRKCDRSFAIWSLQPGDEVLWRFETYL